MSGLIGRAELLARPQAAARALNDQLPNSKCSVVYHDSGSSVVEVVFGSPLELATNGYPVETVRIAQFADVRHVAPSAFPIGPHRSWHHRYPNTVEIGSYGQLCLWYPHDPARLVWHWRRGLVDFVAITQRHVWFEEYYRRHGMWPVEDAPHGDRPDNRPHPIRRATGDSGSQAA